MEDYRLNQTGQEVQNILNGAAMQTELAAETERATAAEQQLQGNIDAEELARQNADAELQEYADGKVSDEADARQQADELLLGNIDAEEFRAKAAEAANATAIETINGKIPAEASAENKLVDNAALQGTYYTKDAIDNLIQGLGQNDVIVGALPASGVANTIYRVPGDGVYSDYMWYDGAWQLLATYSANIQGYQYIGIATPTTNPGTPSNNVFYFAHEAGTYTNFGSLVITQGINILKFDGTTWSLEQLVGIDAVPTAGSVKIVQSGGISTCANVFHFVGKGDYYVSNEFGKVIKGHTYRIYPVLTQWDFATTRSAAIVCRIGYMKNDDTDKWLYEHQYKDGDTVASYVNVTIGEDAKDNSGILIGGRAASGTKVWFVKEDISLIKAIDNKLVDYGIIRKAVEENCYRKNYKDNRRINTVFREVVDSNCFLSDFIPCVEGDVITWAYSGSGAHGSGAVGVYDANQSPLNTGWANSGGTNGKRTLTNDKAGSAYIKVTFVKEDGYVPSVYINGELVWIKEEDGIVKQLEDIVNEHSSEISAFDAKTDNLERTVFGFGDAVEGEVYATGGSGRTTGGIYKKTGWRRNSSYIPCTAGNVVRYVIGGSKSSVDGLILYDSEYNLVSTISANNKTSDDERVFTVSNESVAYVRISFYGTLTNGDENIHPLLINDVPVVDGRVITQGLDEKVNDIENELNPSLPEYGVIGENYPEQIDDVVNKLSYRFNNRFHFLHLSDNHNSTYAHAEEFLDLCPAKFLINTGDLVADKFTDSKANTIAYSIAPDKPVYLVLGNHDYSHASSKQAVYDAFFGDAETEGTINYHNSQAGGVVATKSYYNADFATEGIKCIILDMNDNQSDSGLPDLGPTAATYGAMSQEQIEWFVTQLQDAAANGLHVCVFIHALPTREKPYVFASVVDNFLDTNYAGMNVNGLSTTTCYRLSFLLDIVDAFINGSSVEFTYNSYEYSFTFATAGHFVAWFAGHTHCDCAGWLTDHENQFAINVCRPTKDSGNSLGTYDGDRLGVHFNYVTIDKGMMSLSVYRVGQQSTVYATERKSFRIIYK